VLRFRILDIVYRSAEEIGCDHRRMEIQAAWSGCSGWQRLQGDGVVLHHAV